VEAGERLLFTLKIINWEGEEKVDVFLEYGILDKTGDMLLQRKETVAIVSQATFVRDFDLRGIQAGNYEIYAVLTDLEGNSTETIQTFKIVEKKTQEREIDSDLIGKIIITALIAGVIAILLYKSKPLIERMIVGSKIKKIVRERGGK